MTSVHHDPDLLSDLSKMKQDLIKMSAILTAESTDKFHTLQGPALVGGSVEVSEEPLEIMEKDLEQVKEDLEKVSKILRSGSFESGTSSRGNDCTYISNSDSDKPILLGSHPKFVTTRLKDVKEIDERKECHIDAKFKVKKNSPTENLKPQVQSHVKSNANACNVKKQASKGNSTDSANTYMVKPEQNPELHASPNVEVTPIGSTKDTVKALQVKMENEQWQKKTMVIGGKHVSCKPCTPNESTALKQTIAKTTKVGEKHGPTQTMSVKAIIQAFQAHQVSSKNTFVPCELNSTTEATSDDSLLVPVFESEVLSYDVIPLEIENVQSISSDVFETKSVPSETADTCTSALDEGSVSAKDEDAAKSFGTSSGHCGSPCSDSYKENTQATSPDSASISSQIGQKKKDSGGSEAPLLVTPCHTLVTEFTKQITMTKADDENGRESASAIYVKKPNLSVIERVSDAFDSSSYDDDWQVSAPSSVQFKLPLHQESDSLSDRADHSMTISLKDSLDGSPLMEESSSYKSPDSIEPSPTKDSPPHDSLENSPDEKSLPSPFPSILSDPSKTIVKPQDAAEDNLDNNDAQFISEEKMLAVAEQFSEQESENKCNDESDTETDGTELLQPIHECALSIDCEMNIPSEDVGIVHCVSTSIYTQHTSPFSAGLHEESRKKEVDKHAAAYITSAEPHVQQTKAEVKSHSEEAEDEQLDVIIINENRLSMHIGHSLWKTREIVEDGRELLVNNIDKTICSISDEKQEETKRPKPIENSAKEQNIQTESRGVTAVISADFVPCATQDELRDLNLALGDQSLEITPQTTPGRTPTEESTPTSEPSSFLFQEGKLFEMTRSGAIDMTKRNYEEEGPGFAFFQIGEQPFEESQDNEQAVSSAASPPQVGLNLTLQFKEQEHDNLKRKTTSQPVVDVDIPCKSEASECKTPEMWNSGTGTSITLNQITTRDGAVEINAFEGSFESIIEHIHTTETTVVRALPPEHSLEEAQATLQASTPPGMPKQSTSCGTTKIPDKIQAKSVYHSRANYTNASPSKKDSSSGAVPKSKIPIKVNYAKPVLHIKCRESTQHKKDKAAIKMVTRRKSVTEEGSALDVETKTLSSKSQSFCKEDLTKSSPTKSTGSPTTVHSISSRRFQSKLPLRHTSVLSATSQTPPKHGSDFLKQNSFSMEEISGKEQLTLAKTEHETGAHSGLTDTSFLVSDSCPKAQDTSSGDIFPSRVVQYPSKPQMHQMPDDKVQSQGIPL
ncbi:uncharacterized protein ACB058_002326 [Synchiropus picturatus]